MKKKFVLYGCGGLAFEIAEYVNDINLKLGSLESGIHVTDTLMRPGADLMTLQKY